VLTKLEGKKIILGVLDLSTHQIETPETVVGRIWRVLLYVSPECVIVAPDFMKYLPRNVAFEKLKAMVAGADLMRANL
jgi:5-methyltetrahydropteroyltriglutamate--homocysteine methyltransferase